MILKKIKTGVISALMILLSSCTTQLQTDNNRTEANKPQVVSTNTIIADLTQTIAGDEINHISLLQAGADPHIYEPVPKDTIALEEADLIIYNGYNLEPNIIKLLNSTGIDAEKLAVGEKVEPLDFEYQGQIEPDPHVWGDIQNAIVMVKAIQDTLIKISPEDEAIFRENARQLLKELEELDIWVKEQISSIPINQRYLITSHDAFQYYAKAYGLMIPGTLIGISTEEKPSAKTVKELVEIIKQTGVKTIFAETTINPTLLETVAQEAQVKVADKKLYADSLSSKGKEADTYIKMLRTNTQTIVEALGN